MKATDNSPLI